MVEDTVAKTHHDPLEQGAGLMEKNGTESEQWSFKVNRLIILNVTIDNGGLYSPKVVSGLFETHTKKSF